MIGLGLVKTLAYSGNSYKSKGSRIVDVNFDCEFSLLDKARKLNL